MTTPAGFGAKPARVAADADHAPWFADLTRRLLNETELLVAGEPHRFAELEAYYFGPDHPDPFTHRHPVQLEDGRWYFHRTGGGYRGGSFKGIDLTFGDGTATFGVLVRTIVTGQGQVIDGPSRTVDHLLTRTKAKGVAALDATIAGRPIWDDGSPVAVRAAVARSAAVYATARVGLSLKRWRGRALAARFVMRPYRYLTEPRRIGKGRPQLVLALHQQGHGPAAIQQLSGVPRHTVDRYIADYGAGKLLRDFAPYEGKDLTTADLCRLIGTWAARFGTGG